MNKSTSQRKPMTEDVPRPTVNLDILIAALTYYADEKNYNWVNDSGVRKIPVLDFDRGHIAREALKRAS